MLQELIAKLGQGIPAGEWILRAERVSSGPLAEQKSLSVAVDGQRLLDILVFTGRKPHWRAWVELYAIRPAILIGGREVPFFGGPLEEALLQAVAEHLGPGERIFVEYVGDSQTLRELHQGVPPVLSRLGFLLFRLGFTWFRDWYIPEGLREGEPKLQAEKPLNEEARKRHERTLIREIQAFLRRGNPSGQVQERARALLSALQGST